MVAGLGTLHTHSSSLVCQDPTAPWVEIPAGPALHPCWTSSRTAEELPAPGSSGEAQTDGGDNEEALSDLTAHVCSPCRDRGRRASQRGSLRSCNSRPGLGTRPSVPPPALTWPPTESKCREQQPSGLAAAFIMMNVLGFESEPHSPLSFVSTSQCQCAWSTLRPVTLLSLWAQRAEGKTLCKVTRLGF